MFFYSFFLILLVIWVIIRTIFGYKKPDQQKQRYYYNTKMRLPSRFINNFGYFVRLIFNIHLFRLPNFEQMKQEAINMNKTDTGILLDDFGDENDMRLLKEISYYQDELYRFNLCESTISCLFRRKGLRLALTERLRIVNNLKCHPEIQNIPIIAPIWITGLNRTGSTFLFDLLALDSKCRSPKAWEGFKPSLPDTEPDPRIKKMDDFYKHLNNLMPGLNSSHRINAHLPEECWIFFRNIGFDTLSMLTGEEDLTSILKYLLETVDSTALYKYHKLLLQLLSHKEFPNNGHWLIKFSLHLLFLGNFLETYPDARIIVIHRDPLKVVPSFANLLLNSTMSNYVDFVNVGKKSLHLCGILADILLENEANKAFLHIQYNDLIKNPLGIIKEIYSTYKLTYTMDFEDRMKEWLDNNPQHKHGRPSYSLETYYLSKREIQLRFRAYCDRFNVVQENS